MQVHLVRSRDVAPQLLDKVFSILNAQGGPVQFKKSVRTIDMSGKVRPVRFEELFGLCRDFRRAANRGKEDVVVLLTSVPNSGNWFSAPDFDGSRSVFIHTEQWSDYVIDADPEPAIAYQVWENLLQLLAFSSIEDLSREAHDPPIGCINDMCSWKPDVTFKLRTGDICRSCLDRLREKGVNPQVIAQALASIEQCRRQLLFSRQTERQGSILDLSPFPLAITRRKLTTSTEALRKFLFLLDYFDALLRTSLIFLGSAFLQEEFPSFMRSQGLGKRPSLGKWLYGLQALASKSRDARIGLPEFSEDLRQRIYVVVKRAERGQIVKLRNEKRGHGYCECQDNSYRNAYVECLPAVREIENLLLPSLVRLRCVYVMDSVKAGDASCRVRCKSLVGAHPDFAEGWIESRPQTFEDMPESFRCSLYEQETDRWISLKDYILYQECPACHHPRVLISDGEQYLDPFVGHRVKIFGKESDRAGHRDPAQGINDF